MPNISQTRLNELIDYARETALMRDNPPAEVDQYARYFLQYEYNLKDLPGVTTDPQTTDETDEIWLTVERLRERPAPRPESSLLNIWISLSDDPNKSPAIKSTVSVQELQSAGIDISIPAEEMKVQPYKKINLIEFGRREELEKEFGRYLDSSWKTWAEEERPRRRTISLYGKLFALKQQLEGGIIDAQIELIWGIGMAVWNVKGTKINFPLIAKPVELSLNERTMAIEIRPRGIDPRIELWVYTSLDNPAVGKLQAAAKEFFGKLKESISPYDKNTFEGLLRAAATLLDPSGIYLPETESAGNDKRDTPKPDEKLKVTDSWVLFARPRGASLFVQDLERFQEKLKQSGDGIQLPAAVAAIVTEPSTTQAERSLPAFRGISMVGGGSTSGGTGNAKDLFFPLPFNDEQVRIVQLLEVSDGVVVQGPPGTGKTHTIANIICHYLALGKRVLVTSMREPALTVLKEKLPEDIQSLAVSLLTNEKAGLKEFEHAIEKIASIVQSIQKETLLKEIEQQERQIDGLHARIAECDRKISDWAQKNLDKINIDGESLEPREAAEEVVGHADDILWLDEEISIAPTFRPQFSDEDVRILREARRVLGEDLNYLGCRLPDFSKFPELRDLLETHQNLAQLAELEDRVDSGDLPSLAGSSPEIFKATQVVLLKLEALQKLRQEIVNAGMTWTVPMIQRLRQNVKDDMLNIFCKLGTEIEAAVSENRKYLERPIVLPESFETNAELTEAVGNLAQGDRPFGLIGIFVKSAEKKQLDAVRILGSAPTNDSDWTYVLEYLKYRKKSKELIIRWNALAGEFRLSPLPIDSSSVSAANAAYALYKRLTEAVQLEIILVREIKAVLPVWKEANAIATNEASAEEAERILSLHLTRDKLAQTWAIKERFQNILSGCTGKITEDIRDFYEHSFGNPELSDSTIQNRWSELLEELRRLHSLAPHLENVTRVAAAIENSGGVKWAEKLCSSPMTAAVDDLLPDNWQKAWRWKRLAVYLQTIDSRSELKQLMKRRTEAEILLGRAYQETVKNRTWLKLKQNTNDAVSAALQAYRTAISRIGRGTGVRAVRYRQNAREAADKANPAIPCWIMPHYRISESLPVELGCFDLVIIDEASQSDLTALPALLRAKKVLVVGDDKQVSPEGVGILEDKIRKLMERYLQNQVDIYRSQMTPERSIYDLFKVVFAGTNIMLKEHFRCVAPIIEYSKREFYKHELKALRLPKQSERLDPPLVDVLVENGVKTRDVNLPEGEFIIQEIKKIVHDPIFQGRSIGVVSLLGETQAKQINERIIQEIGLDLQQKFKIRCGDARNFQGEERDIIFLTMIASKNNAHPLVQDTHAKRFNVAASRARDRMYLVRSVTLDELKPNDKFRRSLIQHFSAPFTQDERRVEDLRALCESDFEREVYDILVERGYKVIPQVPVAGFRIDMVVEGDNDTRLAIECDGDRYHGPDRWDDDMRRQRILERAGWQFWRCFASTFVMHKKEVIEDLINHLTERGIQPIGNSDAVISRFVEQRRFLFTEKTEEIESEISGGEEMDEDFLDLGLQNLLFPDSIN